MNRPTVEPSLDHRRDNPPDNALDNRLRGPLAPLLAAPGSGWDDVVAAWRDSAEGRRCEAAVDARVAEGAEVYPARPLAALALTPLAAVRAVIVGQDPYHRAGQAHGLAFSVPAGVRLPPSLRNILAELRVDLGMPAPSSGDLSPWARRGVLLLNSVLTVEAGRPASHAGFGWQPLVRALLRAVIARPQPSVFLLWGAHAQQLVLPLVGDDATERGGRHLLLCANHPSPLSARRGPVPFIGCGHFSRAAAFAAAAGGRGLDWTLS